MINAREFVDKFKQIQLNHRWSQPAFPAEIVDTWGEFVEECEDGYSMGLAEYMNDRMIRDQIEVLLTHPDLRARQEMAWFRTAVAEIDERFRALLDPAPSAAGKPWWEAGVPRRGGRELAEDLKATQNIDIELSD
jgi:hypothetical protein